LDFDSIRYVFRKPLWRKVVPGLLLAVVWTVPFILLHASLRAGNPNMMDVGAKWLLQHGITTTRACWIAAGLSLPLLLWLYYGCETLVVTPEAIVRRLPFARRQTLRWTEVDEVLIEHIESRMEGSATMKKVMTLYAVPQRWVPWRAIMKVSNREFEGFHQVERLVAQVSIPAIAARKRAEIAAKQKPARFVVRDPGEDVWVLIYAVSGVALLVLWGLDQLWPAILLSARPYVAALAVLVELLAVRKFLYRQIGMDEKNIYIMRRNWVMRTIPIDLIADVRVRDNSMRIFARKNEKAKPRVAFKTRRFIRNRGVLLRLIREAHDARRIQDATPIVPVREIEMIRAEEPPATSSSAGADTA
jgi:hypothetical protein